MGGAGTYDDTTTTRNEGQRDTCSRCAVALSCFSLLCFLLHTCGNCGSLLPRFSVTTMSRVSLNYRCKNEQEHQIPLELPTNTTTSVFVFTERDSEADLYILVIQLLTSRKDCFSGNCGFRYFIDGSIRAGGYLSWSSKDSNSNRQVYFAKLRSVVLGGGSKIRLSVYLEKFRSDRVAPIRGRGNYTQINDYKHVIVLKPLCNRFVRGIAALVNLRRKNQKCSYSAASSFKNMWTWVAKETVVAAGFNQTTALIVDNALTDPSTPPRYIWIPQTCIQPWLSASRFHERLPNQGINLVIVGTSRFRIIYNDILRLFGVPFSQLAKDHSSHVYPRLRGNTTLSFVWAADDTFQFSVLNRMLHAALNRFRFCIPSKISQHEKPTVFVVSLGIHELHVSEQLTTQQFEDYYTLLLQSIWTRCKDVPVKRLIMIAQPAAQSWKLPFMNDRSTPSLADEASGRNWPGLQTARTAAFNVAKRFNITYVDFWDMTNPMFDRTTDKTHYSHIDHKSVIGNEVSLSGMQMLLHSVLEALESKQELAFSS